MLCRIIFKQVRCAISDDCVLLCPTSNRIVHARRSLTVRATTGDIGGGGGGAGKGGAGGGGGRRWDGDEGEQPKKRVLWQGWADRVAADPQFVYKVIIEQVSAGLIGFRVVDDGVASSIVD